MGRAGAGISTRTGISRRNPSLALADRHALDGFREGLNPSYRSLARARSRPSSRSSDTRPCCSCSRRELALAVGWVEPGQASPRARAYRGETHHWRWQIGTPLMGFAKGSTHPTEASRALVHARAQGAAEPDHAVRVRAVR